MGNNIKNAFSVFVFGKYEVYLPYYIYTIEKSYPDADVVIFYNAKLSADVKKYISNKVQVVVYEDFYKDYDYFRNYKMKGGGGMTLLRYLIPSKYFVNYRNVYFGDVDVLILKDYQNLFEFHVNQAKEANLPFSNKVRMLPNGGLSKRFTGLHFIITKPYYKLINPIIEKVFADEVFRNNIIEPVNRDEEFLYQLNKLAFNFLPENLINNKTPLHGFHLGAFRGGKEIHPNEIRDNSLLSYEEIKAQLGIFNKNKEFLYILKTFYNTEMIKTLKYFELYVPIQLRIKYFFKTKYRESALRKVKIMHYLKLKRNV